MAAFELLHLTDSVFSASRVLRRASERHGNEGVTMVVVRHHFPDQRTG
jgi:hypothetical protein